MIAGSVVVNPKMSVARKVKSFVIVTLSGTGFFAAVSLYKSDEKFYKNIVMPVLHRFDPEFTHKLAVTANKYRLLPKARYTDPDILQTVAFGKSFSNPIGVAAGFDKQAEAVNGLHNLGFGFVEIGSVTPEPQPGNPKPRVFRLPEDYAVINRYGFNSDGHEKVFRRLENLRKDNANRIVGVNLGKNKDSEDALEDYIQGIKKFATVADYLVINISSPNTPGLRALQNKRNLTKLLSTIVKARDSLPPDCRRPLLVKLAPDLTKDERKDIADVVRRSDCRVDGLIISNTSTERNDLINTVHAQEQGGLSGKPLANVSTQMIAEMYNMTNGIPIIGVGGVFSGEDAYEKIKAGASLIQIYTAFIYLGPPCATRIKRELAQLLERDGYKSISEAVGKEAKNY